jgi:hypothetical protein
MQDKLKTYQAVYVNFHKQCFVGEAIEATSIAEARKKAQRERWCIPLETRHYVGCSGTTGLRPALTGTFFSSAPVFENDARETYLCLGCGRSAPKRVRKAFVGKWCSLTCAASWQRAVLRQLQALPRSQLVRISHDILMGEPDATNP